MRVAACGRGVASAAFERNVDVIAAASLLYGVGDVANRDGPHAGDALGEPETVRLTEQCEPMRVERGAAQVDRLLGRRRAEPWIRRRVLGMVSHHLVPCSGPIGSKVLRRPAIAGMDHTADHPPPTDNVAPVMFAASSPAPIWRIGAGAQRTIPVSVT